MRSLIEGSIPRDSSKNRSTSRSHQFKQVISLLLNGLPEGHFLAYCLVSKASDLGLFVTDKLVAINTCARQITIHSQIPKLPLKHINELPNPKEAINIDSKLEVFLQKASGQVVIKREDEKEKKCKWNFTMGSNKVRQQFIDILTKLINTEPKVKKIKSFKIEQVFPQKNQVTISNKNYESVKIIIPSQIDKQTILFDNKFNIEERLKENSPVQNSITHQWIEALSFKQRSEIYNRFVRECTKRVESIMDNFMAHHLIHEQYTHLKVIRDSLLQIYYLPLINSTQEEEILQPILKKIEEEYSMIEEFECLNYLSSFSHQFKDIRVVTPMLCILKFNSFVFYCKNSIEQYRNKQRMGVYQYEAQMNLIEKAIHLKLINSKQEIYVIRKDEQVIFYFNRLSCIPKISSSFPIPIQYIRLFIKEGIISSKKDLQAVESHIKNKLIGKIKQGLRDKSFFSSLELEDYLQQSGLPYYYLPFLLINQQGHIYTYAQKLVASQIISRAMTWELRRRMHIHLLKKKDFLFAMAQLKITLCLLIKQDKTFIQIIQSIIKHMFHFTFQNILPLRSIIQIQTTISSIFHKLGFNCKGAFLTSKKLDWIWSAEYINNFIQLTPYIDCEMLNLQILCEASKVIKDKLLGEVNQVNFQTKLQNVLQALNISKDTNGLYPISAQYAILNSPLKKNTNFYLSHYISPSADFNVNSLQSQLYSLNNYYTHSLQYLTTLNKLRWLARMKSSRQISTILDQQIEKGVIWNQFHYLINLYSFYAKFKFKEGHIGKGLQYTLQSLQYALLQYKREPSLFNELLIAQQAFEAANVHYSMEDWEKAFELYEKVESVLSKLKIHSHRPNLNEQFLQIYINKCSIYLLYGQYQECITRSLAAIGECQTFKNTNNTMNYQFKIYQILFQCYQIKNMHSQLFEVSSLCSKKYLQQPLYRNKPVSLTIISEVIKMSWLTVIKQVQLASSNSILSGEAYQQGFREIYLKKIKNEVIALKREISQTDIFTKEQAFSYLSHRILKYPQNQYEYRLRQQIVKCLTHLTQNRKGLQLTKVGDSSSFENEWAMLEVLACFTGFNFLVGSIDENLHIYLYEY